MWNIYLPIAKISVNAFLILFMGSLNGLFAGLFGVGGSFASIPMMIVMGIQYPICIAATSCQMVATSTNAVLHQKKSGLIDSQVMIFLVFGIVSGSISGIYLHDFLDSKGLVDICIAFTYIFIIGFIGVFMFNESARATYYKYKNISPPVSGKSYIDVRSILDLLPIKVYFIGPKMEISAIIPIAAGFAGGILFTVAGIAISFLLVPVLLYTMKLPIKTAFGTSTITALIAVIIGTISQSANNYSIDIILALLLTIGAIIGIQIGSRLSSKMPPEELRLMISIIIMVVVFKMVIYLFVKPKSLYTISFL